MTPVPDPNEAMGDAGFYTFHDFWVDGDEGDQEVRVNVGSGNLFIRAKMGELAGPGVSPVAYRVYNSQNDIAGGFIGPWREDYTITGLTISSSTVVYFDGTGARWEFGQDYDGTWFAPPGLNATLEQNSDGTWTLSYDRTGEQIQFNGSGWMTARADRNGVGITYGYAGDRVVAITDAVGKSLGMTYQSAGGGYQLDTVGAYGRHVDLDYDASGRLATVDKSGADRPVWTMTYDSAGRLATLSGGDPARTFAFDYDGADRVTKVTQTRTNQTIITEFDYTATGTILTDGRGNTVT